MAARSSGLAARLAAGETLFTAWSSIPDAMTIEALARTRFDAVCLDMQHGGHHEDSVLRSMLALAHSAKPGLVRIPVGRFDMASRALDFGSQAVIAPMVNSVEDAKAFAGAMKYPPVGGRSWGATFAMARQGAVDGNAWLQSANGDTLAFAMIETREALEALDGILGVPGIDGVLVGPSDFSIAWTGGKSVDHGLREMMDAIGDIASRAGAAGKHAAIYAADPGQAPTYRAMGFRLIALGSEARYMALGAEALIDEAGA